MQLLPDRRIVHLIMELIGNRSLSVTPANGTTPQERRPTGIRFGTPSFQHLNLWHANHCLQKVGYAYANDLAIMHADGDWQTVKEVQSKGMAEPRYLGGMLDRSLTYRQHLESVTSQKVDITHCTLEATCWLWLGCWCNNVANSHLTLVHSTAYYCASVWCRSAHTYLTDPTINDA